MSSEQTTREQQRKPVRVVAILATYNEERFISGCLDHLLKQGVEVYLIDNCSTDRTVEIAEHYLGRGLIQIEILPRKETDELRPRLKRKEELAVTLEADWIMHVDADEIHLPPRQDQTLAEALTEVEEEGYNVVDFQEFTFVPTRESPDHDHPEYQETMRWYYPFTPFSPRLMRAWQRQEVPVGLSRYGGHRIDFPGIKVYPVKFPMKHYLFLSKSHILHKYGGNRNFDKAAVRRGWHGWRASLEESKVQLPSQDELRFCGDGYKLDASTPREHHVTEEWSSHRAQLGKWTMLKRLAKSSLQKTGLRGKSGGQ